MKSLAALFVVVVVVLAALLIRSPRGYPIRSGGVLPFTAFVAVVRGDTAPVASTPYDVLVRNYAPYCVAGDDHAFPMKVWGLSANEYAFWRGSRDLYYTWAKENTKDWLADAGAYVTTHGDLHLGNIGSYAKEGSLGDMSFGAVDFDDTARLPFQLELLQGLITLRLAARSNNIDLAGGRRDEVTREMYNAYAAAISSDKTPRQLVADDRRVGKFIDLTQKHSYDTTLEKFTAGDKFRPFVHTKKGDRLKEILRPAMERADDMAAGIALAIEHSAGAKNAFRFSDVQTIRASIKDVAIRTRMESVGSQGLRKYLVLLRHPLKGTDMDVVMYLKQEIPAAAERAGAIPLDPRSAGRRCSEDMDVLTNPTAYLNSWCDIGKESYWVTFKEPWSEEIDLTMVRDYDHLKEMARLWGKVAGSIHRQPGKVPDIQKRLSPALFDQLKTRATQYMAELDTQYHSFTDDPRAIAGRAKAQAIVDAAKADVTAAPPP